MLFIQLNRPLQNTSAQGKLKIAIEDNFTGNQSTDSVSVASSQKNNECSEKLSEARVSYTYKLISQHNFNTPFLLALDVLGLKWLKFNVTFFWIYIHTYFSMLGFSII